MHGHMNVKKMSSFPGYRAAEVWSWPLTPI